MSLAGLKNATGAKDVLLYGSAPLRMGSGLDTSTSLRPLRQPQHQPLLRADPRATSCLCPPHQHTHFQTVAAPCGSTVLFLSCDSAGWPWENSRHPANGAWHVAGLSKSKSWKCRDPADIREPSLLCAPQRRSRAPPRL